MLPLPDADPPAVLVVIPDSAQATCADLDEDGGVGLSELTMQFKHPSTPDLVRFVLVPTKEDIDASGVYEVDLRVGGDTLTTRVQVFVKTRAPARGTTPMTRAILTN